MVWVLIAAAAAIAALLFAPVRLRAGLDGDGRTRWFAEAAALDGLVRVGMDGDGRYWVCGRWRGVLKPSADTRAAAASPAERGRELARKWGGLGGDERRALVRMLADILSAVDLAVRGNIRYGFADPAVTAWLHALHCIARSAEAMTALQAQPDFADAGWSGHMEAVLTVRPAWVVLPAARFFVRLLGGRMMNKWTGGKRKWQVQT